MVEEASSDECDNDENGELNDETIAAGDQHRVEIAGGTHASMMSLENAEQIASTAPAEGQKPVRPKV